MYLFPSVVRQLCTLTLTRPICDTRVCYSMLLWHCLCRVIPWLLLMGYWRDRCS